MIDFLEFKQIMEKFDPSLEYNDIKKMFKDIDKDETGTITLDGILLFRFLF
jgi:Ca2+-binding EF-hand superfamily protein